MTKKLGEILVVAPVFGTLANKHYNNFGLSYKIAKANKLLNEQREFYTSEERKIVETYAVKDENGQVKIVNGNQISFKDKDDAIKFNTEINKLQQTEVEIFEPIEIKFNDFRDGEMDLTPSDILALEGFVIFNDEEENSGRA